MISIDEVNKTILDLEQNDTSYATCERLAWLYIVRDHFPGAAQPMKHEMTNKMSGSEFLEVCSDIDIVKLLNVLDEHMSVVQLIMPKEYYALIEKIEKLK